MTVFTRAALVAIALFSVGQVSAATLSYSLTNPTGAANVISGTGNGTLLTTPGTDNFGNSFTVPNGQNLVIGAPLTGGGFGFYDDYIFQITDSTVNSLTSTITLGANSGISNLQVRLFALPSDPSYGTNAALHISPGVPVINAWSTAINSGSNTITYSVLPDTALSAGTYVLQVRGLVSGTSNGSYSGVINTVVPIPAAVWLFGSALGMLAWVRRKAV
jgi:hypothetical protein